MRTQNILTQNKKVKEFEKNWSKWLGVSIVFLLIQVPQQTFYLYYV